VLESFPCSSGAIAVIFLSFLHPFAPPRLPEQRTKSQNGLCRYSWFLLSYRLCCWKRRHFGQKSIKAPLTPKAYFHVFSCFLPESCPIFPLFFSISHGSPPPATLVFLNNSNNQTACSAYSTAELTFSLFQASFPGSKIY